MFWGGAMVRRGKGSSASNPTKINGEAERFVTVLICIGDITDT